MMNPPKADYCHEYNEQEGNTTKDESVKRIKEVGKSNSDICPRCGKALKIREGKFGKFKGCTGYPNCKYTENITS
jgi:ssDNA-binding Zn-finger/Zn-ribbon topoisomerase 1